jgi:hypothetical protein
MLLDEPADVGFTGPGSDVGTLFAADVHVLIEDGHTPPGAGWTNTEPGVLDVVAQFTYAVVWARSVTYGARVKVALKPL